MLLQAPWVVVLAILQVSASPVNYGKGSKRDWILPQFVGNRNYLNGYSAPVYQTPRRFDAYTSAALNGFQRPQSSSYEDSDATANPKILPFAPSYEESREPQNSGSKFPMVQNAMQWNSYPTTTSGHAQRPPSVSEFPMVQNAMQWNSYPTTTSGHAQRPPSVSEGLGSPVVSNESQTSYTSPSEEGERVLQNSGISQNTTFLDSRQPILSENAVRDIQNQTVSLFEQSPLAMNKTEVPQNGSLQHEQQNSQVEDEDTVKPATNDEDILRAEDVAEDPPTNLTIVGTINTRCFDEACKEKGYEFDGGHLETKLKNGKEKSITFVVWFRTRDTTRVAPLFYVSDISGTNNASQLIELRRPRKDSTPKQFVMWKVKLSNMETLFNIETKAVVKAGIWTHIVATYNAVKGIASIYINGAKKQSKKVDQLPTGSAPVWGPDLLIGSALSGSGSQSGSFRGGMVRMRVMQRALSDVEIKGMKDAYKPQEGGVPYFVTVCSGDTPDTRTSSSAYIQLIGVEGRFGEFKVGSGFGVGCAKAVTVHGPYLGVLTEVIVRKRTDGILKKDWKLEQIKVEEETKKDNPASEIFVFYCLPTLCEFKDSKNETLVQTLKGIKQVRGGWSEWSQWSGCGSGLCEGNRRVRTRSCTNPLPVAGGSNCLARIGNYSDIESDEKDCPVHGEWGAWTPWSECTEICGGSKVQRTRQCDSPKEANGGKPCEGPNTETMMDCTEPCDASVKDGGWSEWGQWTTCSKSCETGVTTRKRSCTNPAPTQGGLACEGDDSESASCTNPCPIDGKWTEWTEWTKCSTSCGPGVRTRERTCDPPPAYDGKDCPGSAKETPSCTLGPCPNAINGKWGAWGRSYSECTEKKYCIQGTRSRTRKCDSPAASEGGYECPGSDTEDHVCPTEKCQPLQGDTVSVKPGSYISVVCKATTAKFAGTGLKSEDIPPIVVSKYLTAIKDHIATSYYAKTTETDNGETITRYCFQPTTALTIDGIQKAFPSYATVEPIENYDKPPGTDETPGWDIALRSDKSFHSAKFMLDESNSYSPFGDLTLENVRFYYLMEPQFQGVVALGLHENYGAVFDVRVEKGPLCKGTSSNTTDLNTIISTLGIPQVSSAMASPKLSNPVLKFFIDFLLSTALSKVPVTDLTITQIAKIRRISGSLTSKDKDVFHFEVLQKKSLAIGLTSDKNAFKNLLDILLSKLKPEKKPGIELFGEMREPTVGLVYSQAGFHVTNDTTFTYEPLFTGLSTTMKKGITFIARMRLPETCTKTVCKIAKAIIGTENWLMLTGNIKLNGGFEIKASVDTDLIYNPKENKVRFHKKELYIQFEPLKGVTVGINIAIAFPARGSVYKNEILQPQEDIILTGGVKLSNLESLGLSLKMEGIVRKLFGISFLAVADLGVEIQISGSSAGIPTALKLSGTLILGKDCYFESDFGYLGSCVRGGVHFQISRNVEEQFFYGKISAITVGKIFRMLGSKLDVPKKIADTGFEEEVVVSYASKKQEGIKFGDKQISIKQGLYVKGKANLLGIVVELTFELSTKQIFVQTVFNPITLPGGVTLTKSIYDTTNGPLFSAKATRTPTFGIEILLQGACKIFGVQTEVKFSFTNTAIEATLKLKLPIINLIAELYIKGGYGTTDAKKKKKAFKDISFTVKASLSTDTTSVITKETSKSAADVINNARAKLQQAQDRIRDEKEKCKKEVVGTYCTTCQNIVSKNVMENCDKIEDRYDYYIGGTANENGGVNVGKAKNVPKTFEIDPTEERRRRSIYYTPLHSHASHAMSNATSHVRKKRFIGKMRCKFTYLKNELKGKVLKKLCAASCQMQNHITKGICKGLDLAVVALHLLERSLSWIKKASDILPKDVFILHSISFQTVLATSLGSSVAFSVDVTLIKVRRQFEFEANLNDVKLLAKNVVNKAFDGFQAKVMFKPRFSKPPFDKPVDTSDYIISAPFRIQNRKSELCMHSHGNSPGSGIGVNACETDETLWTYTLTGEIMNVQSALCLTVTGSGTAKIFSQQPCKKKSVEQKFTCYWNLLLVQDTDCLVEKGGGVAVETCRKPKKEGVSEDEDEEEEEETSPTWEWIVKGDPRLKICDQFVVDLAIGKPAVQSSTLSEKDFINNPKVDPLDKKVILSHVGADRAVNGDMSFYLREGSCAHTSLEQDPWWRVDLQQEYIITDVTIQTAVGGFNVEALGDFEIHVGALETESKKNPMCGPRVINTHMGELWTSLCSPSIPGRYVSVHTFGMVYLTLSEVAVFSRTDNNHHCSETVRKRRSEMINYKDIVLKRATITQGYYH